VCCQINDCISKANIRLFSTAALALCPTFSLHGVLHLQLQLALELQRAAYPHFKPVIMVLSQILRFALPQASSAISAPAFLKLREFVRSHGQVEDQYFGYVTSVSGGKKRKTSDEMCWVIRSSFRGNLKVHVQG
jgi:hypothetical protein